MPHTPDSAKLEPVTPSQLEMFEKPTIISQFPLEFPNGCVLGRFEGACSICGTPIKPQDLHGTITQPFAKVAVIEAIGGCDSCRVYVPFFMRIKDDGRTETRDSNGNWVMGRVDVERPMHEFQEKAIALALAAMVLITFISLAAR